jgi:hypothetical protein
LGGELVLSSPSHLSGFVTNDVELFIVDSSTVQRCSMDRVCVDLVAPSVIHRVPDLQGRGPSVSGLSPRAIAMSGDRVMFSDGTLAAIVICPVNGPCDEGAISFIQADDENGQMGAALAAGGPDVVWTQGNQIVQSTQPTGGPVQSKSKPIGGSETRGTLRLVHAGGLFWLTPSGVFRGGTPGESPEHRLEDPATDFAVDADVLFVATTQGLLRVGSERGDRKSVADGNFVRVAVGGGVYGARTVADGVEIVEVHSGENDIKRLARSAGELGGLAVAGRHVYFMTYGAGGTKIRRVTR